jgi:hypothetical protein
MGQMGMDSEREAPRRERIVEQLSLLLQRQKFLHLEQN